jgi:hypothetical protein
MTHPRPVFMHLAILDSSGVQFDRDSKQGRPRVRNPARLRPRWLPAESRRGQSIRELRSRSRKNSILRFSLDFCSVPFLTQGSRTPLRVHRVVTFRAKAICSVLHTWYAYRIERWKCPSHLYLCNLIILCMEPL